MSHHLPKGNMCLNSNITYLQLFRICEKKTAGCTWTDYKTNSHIAKELEITPVLDKLLEYKRNWIQHVNRMPRDRLPRIMKHYSPTGRRNRGRPLKRLLDTWDQNRSTSGLTPWQTCDGDDYCIRSWPWHGDQCLSWQLTVVSLMISGTCRCSKPCSGL